MTALLIVAASLAGSLVAVVIIAIAVVRSCTIEDEYTV